MRQVTLISTGGTIEKTYDEHTGELSNRSSVVQSMLQNLRLEATTINSVALMRKDSLDLTDSDRRRIGDAIRLHAEEASPPDGVVVLHGTDTLCDTGEILHKAFPSPAVPIVLTGAIRPYEMKLSDALQNLSDAIFASGVLKPGVWVVAHGRALPFPGIIKDRVRNTFVRREEYTV